MTHHTPTSSNPSSDGMLVLEIDGQHITVGPELLADPQSINECIELLGSASSITIHNWQHVLDVPTEYQTNVVDIVASSATRPIFVVYGNAVDGDAFNATLATNLGADINRRGRGQELAIRLARALYSDNADEPAEQIRQWLTRNGGTTPTRQQITSRITGCSTTRGSSKQTPQEAARSVLDHVQRESLGDGEMPVAPPLRYFHSKFYRWRNQAWHEVPDPNTMVTRALQETCGNQSITNSFSASVLENLRAFVELTAVDMVAPLVVHEETPLRVQSKNIIAFENGYVELPDRMTQLRLQPSDARVFLPLSVDYRYEAAAECPLWMSTLREIFPQVDEHDHRVLVLQELFGYCLLRGYSRLEKLFILLGVGANGKSMVLAILRAMLGAKNVSSVPLENFANRFLIGDMDRKSANISFDMHRIPKVQEGVLKQLVSGEPTQVDVKLGKPFTMLPTAKLIFASNHLPTFGDTSDGVYRRLCVIPFRERFNEAERDVDRAERLRAELPGIFNWAVAGAQRILQQQSLTACAVCDDAVAQHRADSDPVAQFIEECCDTGADLSEPASRLYSIYRSYCQFNGRFPKANNEFGKDILQTCGISKVRPTVDGERVWTYRGLALRQECVAPDRDRDGIKYNPRTQARRSVNLFAAPPLSQGNVGVGIRPPQQ